MPGCSRSIGSWPTSSHQGIADAFGPEPDRDSRIGTRSRAPKLRDARACDPAGLSLIVAVAGQLPDDEMRLTSERSRVRFVELSSGWPQSLRRLGADHRTSPRTPAICTAVRCRGRARHRRRHVMGRRSSVDGPRYASVAHVEGQRVLISANAPPMAMRTDDEGPQILR